MEARTKAIALTALIVLDGCLTWATIEAGGSNGRELNPLFADTHALVFIPLAIIKAIAWMYAWLWIQSHPKAGMVAGGLLMLYGGLCVWNVGNLVVNL